MECADCHNAHAVNDRPATAPDVSGRLDGAGGMTIERSAIKPALYEYEVCFKCHAELSQHTPFIPRVINNTNTQETFSELNPSSHPVVGARNLNIPSIPSAYEPGLSGASMIYCTDCHSDNADVPGASNGPHGSDYAPILKYQYETTDDFSPESPQKFALCYRCHDRNSILNDESFTKNINSNKGGHSDHLAAGATCAACHDAHGIVDDGGITGSHTHLINFSTLVVSPSNGNPFPLFNDNGPLNRSCTLVCHVKGVAYPHNSTNSLY